MLDPKDKLIEVILYTPHKCDYIYEREDKTHYVSMKRGKEQNFELLPNPSNETRWILGEEIVDL